MPDRLLSLKEAAERLNVHPGTVRRWADNGSIASVRTPGGHRRFSALEVERLLQTANENPKAIGQIGATLRQRALVSTREHLQVQQKPDWLAHMDEASREEKRLLGRRLLGLLMQYIAADDGEGEAALEEAKVIGRIYAKSIVQSGMPLADAMRATMFFRDHILESAVMLPESARRDPDANKRVFKRVSTFLNAIQLVVAETYGAAADDAGRAND